MTTSAFSHDALVHISRRAPGHRGHGAVFLEALERGRRLVLLSGSSFRPRTVRTPLLFEERAHLDMLMIQDLTGMSAWEVEERVSVLPLPDFTYRDSKWKAEVQRLVSTVTKPEHSIGLIGWHKDHTSYYLKQFPQWGNHIGIEPVDTARLLSATDVRDRWYTSLHTNETFKDDALTPRVSAALDGIYRTAEMLDVAHEWLYINDFKADTRYTVMREKPTFSTADAVVTVSGHVLAQRPGGQGKYDHHRDLHRLPGAFFNTDLDGNLTDTAIRALKTKAQLDVSPNALHRCLQRKHLFDNVHRDPRGPIFTYGHHFELVDRNTLPEISPDFQWVPLSQIDTRHWHLDHADIVNFFVD